MWKRVLLAFIVIVAIVVGLALLQPATFRVERSALVKAPPEKVFGYLDDFHQWPVWSPWERLDPAMRRTFSGPPKGPGAVYAWNGNDDVGQGRMEIVASRPPTTLAIALDFVKPFKAHNDVRFVLQPRPEGTLVTWTMSGDSPFVLKLIGVFASADQMAGPDFEQGLAYLKEAAEAPRGQTP
ncbi:polyketide cyclase/dehydrase/lipid transport protein [Pseudoduganella flava]|uniref:Polyketide cyclase n=1 Tax=Pseudoduganella flava TaxID=871742 RepID=A0A562PZ39_9BURK|nr:SRPBCC family protein [Pseudoduganella flava]QGZ38758.1 polyketide cyclase [Pseudoduganella flava]TWI49663.1 polyketide cyclase/dehydrase/lipid transport protein [Pseudoduganella flava]